MKEILVTIYICKGRRKLKKSGENHKNKVSSKPRRHDFNSNKAKQNQFRVTKIKSASSTLPLSLVTFQLTLRTHTNTRAGKKKTLPHTETSTFKVFLSISISL